MRSRKLALLLSVVMLVGLIAGCAAPAAPASAPAAEQATATAEATEAAAEAAPAGPFEPMSLAADNCDYGGEFKSIEAVDASTVKMTLCYPDPAFPAKVAFSAFRINDADYLQATGGGGDLIEKPVGTGPYKLVEWRRGDQIIFERNEDFWGDKASAQNLVFRWSPESAQRLVELQSGTVDGIDNPGPDDFETIQKRLQPAAPAAQRHQRVLRQHEQHVPAVRQRTRTPGACHGDRPPAHCRQLLSAGFVRRHPVHAALHLRLQRRTRPGTTTTPKKRRRS